MNARDIRRLLPAVLGLIVLAGGGPSGSSGQSAGARRAAPGTKVHSVSTAREPRRPNRLIREKSPYLLQHAYNPVDWYPWGTEAFDRARREGKPVFLSIGYSTCHWCHVMERESFADDSVARLLNRHFVCIKVDREERPDVDRVYMTAAQVMGVGGGWPLTLFLTPEGEPFFGGTYFPRSTRNGRTGLLEVLPRIHAEWRGRRAELTRTGKRALEMLGEIARPDPGSRDRGRLLQRAYERLRDAHDPEHGGFGAAPKFPSVENLSLLLGLWARDRAAHADAKRMVTLQLDAMRAGGIHDHLGGGFHRYATDAAWRVPHFEKMLYDQAQLAIGYLEGYRVTGNPDYAATARGIFAYVLRDLALPEGPFAAAEDADSEGQEGRFYVWRPTELEQVLGKPTAEWFAFRHGVTASGNFERSSSVLREDRSLPETARRFRTTATEMKARLARAREVLLEARGKRVRPHRDDQSIVAWNGLMIGALARGARVLGDSSLAHRAERAAEFLWGRLYDPATGSLRRSWRAGPSSAAGQLDDYAHFAYGLIDLYQATFDSKWLGRAVTLTEAQNRRFWDEQDGAFFESPADPRVPVRLKAHHDGAELAGSSIAVRNLLLLGTLLDRDDWLERARKALDYHAARLGERPERMSQMLVAMDLERSPRRHIVIAGRRDSPETRRMLAELNRRFLPNDLVLLVEGTRASEELGRLAPFTRSMPVTSRATAYVCVDHACRLPARDARMLAAQLDERRPVTTSRR